jgi:hypothetical protein
MRGVGTLMSNGVHRYHDAMATRSPSSLACTRAALLVTVLVISACGGDDDNVATSTTSLASATTIESGSPVTTDVVTGIADDVPAGAIPTGAQASSTMAGNATSSTTVTEFTVSTTSDRETMAGATRSALEADGWVFRERLYDDVTMQSIFDGPDGAVLTQVLTIDDDGISGVVTVVRN